MPQIVLSKGKEPVTDTPFEPCAATASHFLFSQGPTVLVLAHDTLALERRFQSHNDNITLISCDNVSERGAGRLVVTYDIGKTAIIWDLFTGEQISRFASYEPLLVAAWMRNGNIAFGNEKGDVILFEPSTSDHISARTIYDPITALAPSSDCKTYAIGYRNGSILLAALQPQFTILHTLNTSRSPSPIAMLTWHASSSKQKSDMLAIQNSDGDLRVWSVPKPPTAGQPRVIRILKRDDRLLQGRNWVCWSRNGRIIQFSEGETWAWDVRTKDVNYVPVPTIEYVRGIAAHGPTASLFTLGPDYTIQQYDVDAGQMIANIRHTPITIPPTPPEDHVKQFHPSSYEEELSSPLKASRYDGDGHRQAETPASGHSASVSTSSRKSADKRSNNNKHEMASPAQTVQTATTFSMGAYTYGHSQAQNAIPASPASARVAGLKKGSRLRQEVVMSPMTPEDALVIDLFPFARARLSEVSQQPQRPLNENGLTPADLRKHMLATVFGWEDDIYSLVQDELSRHPPESLNALFLTKWLDYGPEAIGEMIGSTPADSGLDWVRLALGILDSRPESKKLGQIFVEKMLSKGEVHMAAVALLALGDKNDAIEVYVSNNCYLEAILLTCMLMPHDWQRQSHLVRKWGEHVVENSQQHLAIRCFSCTGGDAGDSWMSPTAQMYSHMVSPTSARSMLAQQPLPVAPQPPVPQQLPQQTPQQAVQQQYQPPAIQTYSAPLNPNISRLRGGRGFDAPTPVALMAPPTPFRTAAAKGTRITPATGGLKLITSFAPKPNQFKFPGLRTDDMTPTAANNVTPIAESAIDRSAISPGGLGSYRLNNIASLNSALSAGGGLSRSRLPSIGEAAHENGTPTFPPRGMTAPRAPPTPADSGSDKEKEKLAATKAENDKQEARNERSEPSLTLLTSAKYEPTSTPIQKYGAELEPQTALRPSTSNSWHNSFGRSQESLTMHAHSGSRGKKPEGLSLQMLQANELQTLPDPIGRPSTVESTTTNFTMSSVEATDTYRIKSPSVSGRSIDQYISSLEQAQHYGRSKSSNSTRASKEEKAERKRSKHRRPRHSEDVSGRPDMPTGKRSPSSPVPMSPEEINMFSASVESFNSIYNSHDVSNNDLTMPDSRHHRRESASTTGTGRQRHRSRSAQPKMKRRDSARGSRKPSPAPDAEAGRRGRSKARKEGSGARSPSSPLPMVPTDEDLSGVSGAEPGAFKFVSQNRSRLHRSSSRRPERGTSARRDPSPDRRRGRPRSPSRQRDYEQTQSRKNSVSMKSSRRKKRDQSEGAYREETLALESLQKLDALADAIRHDSQSNPRLGGRDKGVAQAELEARRASLARRPSAPTIPMPGQGSMHLKSASDGITPPPLNRTQTDSGLRPFLLSSARYDNGETRGRPGTPKAMDTAADVAQQMLNGHVETFSNESYLLPARTYSATANREDQDFYAPSEPPQNMPRHPAFDHRVGNSRGNSRTRTRTASPGGNRAMSVERPRAVPEQETPPMVFGSVSSPEEPSYRTSLNGPTIIPELQHLAVPPPPPPPPAPPKDLRIQTDLSNIATIPLPKSAYPASGELSATPDKQHKRVSSRNEGQFMGKIRGITDRMRSNSKPRDNSSRSPNIEEGIMSPYETVTVMPPPLSTLNERR
ncbi:hypothetical protein PMZ80_001625 [Knufia obscura]|uniref:Gem-associated protein 5 TPR domain-containing protein n=1 Tax=Knufia obscura TaxID=1635080 RepID=A0ABR0S3N0_9EURO|nr:hypothetical protein PMZ80_001625 [Knufia obscura]